MNKGEKYKQETVSKQNKLELIIRKLNCHASENLYVLGNEQTMSKRERRIDNVKK